MKQHRTRPHSTHKSRQHSRHADHTAGMSLMDFAGRTVVHSESKSSAVDVEGGHADTLSSPAEEQRQEEEEEHEQQQRQQQQQQQQGKETTAGRETAGEEVAARVPPPPAFVLRLGLTACRRGRPLRQRHCCYSLNARPFSSQNPSGTCLLCGLRVCCVVCSCACCVAWCDGLMLLCLRCCWHCCYALNARSFSRRNPSGTCLPCGLRVCCIACCVVRFARAVWPGAMLFHVSEVYFWVCGSGGGSSRAR